MADDIGPDHKEVEYLSEKGLRLMFCDRYEEAIEYFDRAIELDPECFDAWIRRGDTLYRLGRHEKAIEALDKAIELRPGKAPPWNRKGQVLNALNRYEEGHRMPRQSDRAGSGGPLSLERQRHLLSQNGKGRPGSRTLR